MQLLFFENACFGRQVTIWAEPPSQFLEASYLCRWCSGEAKVL